MSVETQKAANIDKEILGKHIQINEQTTIQELDEIILWANGMLVNTRDKEEQLIKFKQSIAEFMYQHHTFDMYVEEMLRASKKST